LPIVSDNFKYTYKLEERKMAKRVRGEDGKMYKVKKPFYKKVWFWIVVLIVIGGIGSMGGEEGATEPKKAEVIKESTASSVEVVESKESKEAVESIEVVESKESKEAVESVEVVESEVVVEPSKPEISREFENALKSAQNYVDLMPFSEKGLYDQLTAEYGEQFPAEAAQYAIENVVVDYNAEALESAKNYQETMPMSDSGLYDQLTSEYGERFTAEQAQYAIDNLE